MPTWNYSDVQAYGRAHILFDSGNDATGSCLQKQLTDLTKHMEENIMHHTGAGRRPPPWEVRDSPSPFIELLKKSIIAIEVAIENEIAVLIGSGTPSATSLKNIWHFSQRTQPDGPSTACRAHPGLQGHVVLVVPDASVVP